MSRTAKRSSAWQRTNGYDKKEKRGAQELQDEKIARRAAAAFAAGAKSYESNGILLVLAGGEVVDWYRADPTKIGR